MSLEATLADSCGRALDRFLGRVGTTPYEAKRARRYLERLTDYKEVVIEMNTNGFKKARATQPTRLGGHPRIKVSATGEYLIARQMGVLAALKDWAKRARFEIALR
ncbi:MAG: hypothetical protein OXC60_08020 [Litoreibacter sp.]|nr:hypothetical protein [Litoreibacter sp.]